MTSLLEQVPIHETLADTVKRRIASGLDSIAMVSAHVATRTFTEVMNIPEHGERKGESPLFHSNVARLKLDGHYLCRVCQTNEDLQVHHACCEWSMMNSADYAKLKQECFVFDPYGYSHSAEFRSEPMTSVDDIRNMEVLCRTHHECKFFGKHNTTHPAWVSQIVCANGVVALVPKDHHKDEDRAETKALGRKKKKATKPCSA